jgi:4-hydroxy-4-methyl-2-oxoglutarate aldolase
MANDALLTALAAYDTPTICNVIELFEVRPRHTGYVKDARIRANSPALPPVVGHAATALARSTYPPQGKDKGYPWLGEQVRRFAELDGPPIVVIQDLDNPPVAAMFGEIMCTTYRAFGGRALLTNGAGRDVAQVAALGDFQLFTCGEIASHGYFHLTDLYVPVEIGGQVIYPNDLLHADRDGITQIPADIAAEIPDAAAEFMESERVFLEVLRQPNVTMEQFKAARAESKALQKRLGQRISRRTENSG